MPVEALKPSPAPSLYTSLRVSDVDRASTFYQKLGFRQTFVIPDKANTALLCFLQYGNHHLIVGKLQGLPYPDTPRERAIQLGPRGLGVKLAFNVTDLNQAYQLCREEHCEITMEPMEEFWGDRIFTCLDPFGYELQIHQRVTTMSEAEILKAGQAAWL